MPRREPPVTILVPTTLPLFAVDVYPQHVQYVSMAGRQVLASAEASLEEMAHILSVARRPLFLLADHDPLRVGYLMGAARVPSSEWRARLVTFPALRRFLGLPGTVRRRHVHRVGGVVRRLLGGHRAAYGSPVAPGPLRGVRGYWIALALALMVTDGAGTTFPRALFVDREFA